MWGRCHAIDWGGIPCVAAGCIKDLSILFARALQNMLWSDEQVGDVSDQPVWEWNNKVIPFLPVHGGHDLVELGRDGQVVEHLPVKKCVGTG
jgi:hypothetical protein